MGTVRPSALKKIWFRPVSMTAPSDLKTLLAMRKGVLDGTITTLIHLSPTGKKTDRLPITELSFPKRKLMAHGASFMDCSTLFGNIWQRVGELALSYHWHACPKIHYPVCFPVRQSWYFPPTTAPSRWLVHGFCSGGRKLKPISHFPVDSCTCMEGGQERLACIWTTPYLTHEHDMPYDHVVDPLHGMRQSWGMSPPSWKQWLPVEVHQHLQVHGHMAAAEPWWKTLSYRRMPCCWFQEHWTLSFVDIRLSNVQVDCKAYTSIPGFSVLVAFGIGSWNHLWISLLISLWNPCFQRTHGLSPFCDSFPRFHIAIETCCNFWVILQRVH